MVWPAIIAAGASLAGGAMNMIGQSNANAQNAAMAEKNMDWQERMSNTAYQRAMADMRAAGLNPILAYSKGGASTPGMSMPDMKNTMTGFMDVGNSAMQAYKTGADVEVAGEQAKQSTTQQDLNKATEALTKASELKTKQDSITSATQAELNRAAAANQSESALNAAVQNQVLQHEVTSAYGNARILKQQADDAEKYGFGPRAQTGGNIERTARRVIDTATEIPKHPIVQSPGFKNFISRLLGNSEPTHGYTWGVRGPTSLKLPSKGN